MIKEQVHIFFSALMFYTRIPCPRWITHDAHYLDRATIYFPVVGWIVGALSFFVFWGASFLFSPLIAVLLSMVASVFITGAFHEDGFADTCDGFGGGWTKERILTIMKDSRLGTYGAVGLFIMLGIKIGALYELVLLNNVISIFFVFITAHSLSRTVAATTLFTHSYCRENEDSKAKPLAKKLSFNSLLIVIALGLVPLLFWIALTSKFYLLFVLIPAYFSKISMARYFKKWIGGYTGDCLGAIQQVSEVLIYLSLIVLWKFV